MLISISAIAFLMYGFILLYVMRSWRPPDKPKSVSASTPFSIIIPVRNEEENILACLTSILNQSHSYYEIIIVDDHSTDQTPEIIQSIKHHKIQGLKSSGSGKKNALNTGIVYALHEWIVTIDADTVFHPGWLKGLSEHANFYDALVGPVEITASKGLLKSLQEWDMVALQGFTKAGISTGRFFMANGANFAFKKSWFEEVGGYTGNLEIASGDDFFLIDKFRQSRPEAIGYVDHKACIATTNPSENFTEFFRQRIRWGGKMKKLNSSIMQFILGYFWLINLIWVVLVIGFLINFSLPWPWIILVLFKMILDFMFLTKSGKFFNKRLHVIRYLSIVIFHAAYMVLSGIMAILPYRVIWKGRKI